MPIVSNKEKVVCAIVSLIECSKLDETDVMETLLITAGITLQALDLKEVSYTGKTGTFTLTVVNK